MLGRGGGGGWGGGWAGGMHLLALLRLIENRIFVAVLSGMDLQHVDCELVS